MWGKSSVDTDVNGIWWSGEGTQTARHNFLSYPRCCSSTAWLRGSSGRLDHRSRYGPRGTGSDHSLVTESILTLRQKGLGQQRTRWVLTVNLDSDGKGGSCHQRSSIAQKTLNILRFLAQANHNKPSSYIISSSLLMNEFICLCCPIWLLTNYINLYIPMEGFFSS